MTKRKTRRDRSHVEIRLANVPCSRRVRLQGQSLKCLDLYRQVKYSSKNKLISMTCLRNGHVSRGRERELANS